MNLVWLNFESTLAGPWETQREVHADGFVPLAQTLIMHVESAGFQGSSSLFPEDAIACPHNSSFSLDVWRGSKAFSNGKA